MMVTSPVNNTKMFSIFSFLFHA